MESEVSQKKTTVDNMGQTSAAVLPAPQRYKLNDTSMEMDDPVLINLGNSMKSTANKNKLKKECKRHKMSGTLQFQRKTISQFCIEGQDTSIVNGSYSKENSSSRGERERNKVAMHSGRNSPAQEMNDAKNTQQGSEHSKSSGKLKKEKKKKHQMSQEILSSAPKHISGGKTYGRSNGEATIEQAINGTTRNDDGISQKRRKHLVSLHQSHMHISTPLSSPTALSKIKRNTLPNGPEKNETANGVSDNSQDLFITQKKFVSSHGSSGDSPPLGQKQGSGPRDSLGSQNPSRLLSQFCLTFNSIDQSSKERVVLVEKATQTDDNFSYLALRSLVKKVKVMKPCSEKALNLSLPTRIRAMRNRVCASDDVIIIKSQSSPVDPNASRKSFLQKADEAKFVQTVLNSSYFFKGKGEPGIENPMTPILKIKKEPKKKSRKSSVHSKRRRHHQHEK